MATESTAASTTWSPLRHPIFRALWMASVASNIGTWMQNVGASWLMIEIAPTPALVALVQTATSLPVFFLGVPAGALADLVDRRKLLIAAQAWMLASSALLGILTLAGWTTPWVLFGLTFALGLGSALNAPAWQSIVPELVPAEDLPQAVSLNSIGFNIARAIGPALSGLLLSFASPGTAFLLNAVSFVGVIAVLIRWQRIEVPPMAATERLAGAIRAGGSYLRYAPELQAVLLQAGRVHFWRECAVGHATPPGPLRTTNFVVRLRRAAGMPGCRVDRRSSGDEPFPIALPR